MVNVNVLAEAIFRLVPLVTAGTDKTGRVLAVPIKVVSVQTAPLGQRLAAQQAHLATATAADHVNVPRHVLFKI